MIVPSFRLAAALDSQTIIMAQTGPGPILEATPRTRRLLPWRALEHPPIGSHPTRHLR
jgi:hypothetical protein